MLMHRVLVENIPDLGAEVRIEGEEARHAVRVKRLEVGEPLELLDGCGRVASAVVAGSEKSGKKGEWALLAEVRAVESRPRVEPLIHVLAPAPKGDRLEEMVDHLSQVGAASWSPLECMRVVREPKEHRLDRLQRIAREAAKQCGRAWALEIRESRVLNDVLADAKAGLTAGTATIMADAGGEHFSASMVAPGTRAIALLFGPEGDWDPRELAHAREAGVMTASFGPHVMRIAQAATAASAIVMHVMTHRI